MWVRESESIRGNACDSVCTAEGGLIRIDEIDCSAGLCVLWWLRVSVRVGEWDRSAPGSESELSIIHRGELQLSALLCLGECTQSAPSCFIDEIFAFP